MATLEARHELCTGGQGATMMKKMDTERKMAKAHGPNLGTTLQSYESSGKEQSGSYGHSPAVATLQEGGEFKHAPQALLGRDH